MQVSAAIDGDIGAGTGQRSTFVRQRSGDCALRRVAGDNRRRSGPRQPLIVARIHLEIVIQRGVDDVEVFVIVTDERSGSDPAVGEVVHGPTDPAVERIGARLCVYTIESDERNLASRGDGRLVAESKGR